MKPKSFNILFSSMIAISLNGCATYQMENKKTGKTTEHCVGLNFVGGLLSSCKIYKKVKSMKQKPMTQEAYEAKHNCKKEDNLLVCKHKGE